MDKSLYITDERAPEFSIPKGAEEAGQYTHVTVVHPCEQSGMFHLWPSGTLVFLKFRIGAFQILSFRLGLLILNSPVLGSTFHEYHGELNVNQVFPLP